MKKVLFFAVAAIAFVACNNKPAQAEAEAEEVAVEEVVAEEVAEADTTATDTVVVEEAAAVVAE